MDVARGDRDEERGDDVTDETLVVLGQRDEGRALRDLDDTGGEDDGVLGPGHPVGHLRLELLALGREVADAGADQEGAEGEASHGAGGAHGNSLRGCGCSDLLRFAHH